jgi:hypothetical protein
MNVTNVKLYIFHEEDEEKGGPKGGIERNGIFENICFIF